MKTMVIGEIGSNWESLEDILKSCEYLTRIGAVPKLQAWKTDLVVNPKRNQAMYDVMTRFELPEKWISYINEKFPQTFYSVFDTESINFLEKSVQPSMYKVASPDCVHIPLLEAVRDTGKDAIVSVGGATLEEIRQTAKLFDWKRLMLMECNASYPAKKAYLGNLRDRITGSRLVRWGYSDHTVSLNVPSLAVTIGAVSIEKHFKYNEMDTPDSPHSLGRLEFARMMDYIKEAEEQMGTLEHPYPEEVETMRVARRKEDGLR